jgi:predicted outer membrane repeat protein
MPWGGSYAGMNLLFVSIVNLQPLTTSSRVVRVTTTGAAAWPCGDSWTNACSLQTALTNAAQGDEVWVAGGVYKPTSTADQTIYFELKAGVAVYGGFAGGETARTARDPRANLTILSGDIGGDDSQSPVVTDAFTVTGADRNSYHVVVTTGNGVTLDGVTITGGYGYYGCPYGWNSQFGGGLYAMGSMSINDVVFSGNRSFYGGGIRAIAPLTITNSTFVGNYATGTGGGLSNGGINTTLTNVVFTNNRSTANGAGAGNNTTYAEEASGSLVLKDVTFAENFSESGNGGGLYVGGLATLTDVAFTHNHAGNIGGGMAVQGETDLVTLTRVSFKNNYGPSGGGGLGSWSGKVVVRDSVFTGNSATGAGAIYSYPGGGIWTLSNVTITNNASSSSGGGIVTSSPTTLENVTLVNNSTSGYGGGILAFAPMTIRNSIIWGNTAGCYAETTENICTSTMFNCSFPTVTYSDVQKGYAGTGNLNVDPLLLPLGDYDGTIQTMALQPGSPAIDAGNDALCAATDARGVPRPQGAHCDMGAYEATVFSQISGNAGVAGATLSYTDGASKTATADSSGNYSFRVSFSWSGTVTPSKAGYRFSPEGRTYSHVLSDIAGQDYTAIIERTISGNAGVGGAVLSYTDGAAKTATADGNGSYSFLVASGWSGTVTPSKTGFAFSPADRTYANVLADQTGQDYAAGPIMYAISGNAGAPGATLSYMDGSARTATADASGNYSIAVSYGWSGVVTPSKAGYTFSPAERTYAGVLADQAGQDYAATAIVFAVSGSTGIAGATLSYSDGGEKTATADGAGNYSFAVSYGWSGTVTPSLRGYSFSPESRTYANVLADQAGQDYAPTAIVYAISGNAGIAGATLSYVDVDARSAAADGAGNYSFTVSYDWSGTVTPSLSGYAFSPADRSYAHVLADQTAQDFAAALIPPPTIASIEPSNGPAAGGTVVSIHGSALSGVHEVLFGTSSACFVSTDDALLTATSPAGSAGEAVSVTVVTASGTSNPVEFTYDPACSGHGIAQGDGSCLCSDGFAGTSCERCADGFAGYPACAQVLDGGSGDDASVPQVDGGVDGGSSDDGSVPQVDAGEVDGGSSDDASVPQADAGEADGGSNDDASVPQADAGEADGGSTTLENGESAVAPASGCGCTTASEGSGATAMAIPFLFVLGIARANFRRRNMSAAQR